MKDNMKDKMKTCCAVVVGTLALASSAGVAWTNVDAEHHRAGRKCSEAYLQGKVVLVAKNSAHAARMEEVWTSFRSKPFVLIGAFEQDPVGVSYPVYDGASLKSGAPETASIYVVDETGRLRYKGNDERRATMMVVSAITDMESPRNDMQFKRFFDWECAELPGRAVVRYQDFKKREPKKAKEYEAQATELEKQKDVKKLAELVRFAREVKDVRAFDPKKAKIQKPKLAAKIKSGLAKFAKLKESENPLVAREAKNAIADLTWKLADL